jgi:hypothetical protein
MRSSRMFRRRRRLENRNVKIKNKKKVVEGEGGILDCVFYFQE